MRQGGSLGLGLILGPGVHGRWMVVAHVLMVRMTRLQMVLFPVAPKPLGLGFCLLHIVDLIVLAAHGFGGVPIARPRGGVLHTGTDGIFHGIQTTETPLGTTGLRRGGSK